VVPDRVDRRLTANHLKKVAKKYNKISAFLENAHETIRTMCKKMRQDGTF
jgi:hypothetical protein